ncbi:carbohydrate ABC transporter ATP-binding protein, CUT1 family [Rubellimicrobium thermophilum DSM 16684]|uniref:Carbohydrate ABC transporter ATP-binding protein, CUT1 family n=1 Tax=Rubellimicrobium thermophilum DSM 16684 TaxID=1123069 RepID=S9SM34_9RHOB|nr:sn-glycerol-3-phosphate ABC transporter ATP-binding protein UgpC [Rubellimicrobium thermophilum]EPX87479.1 carbohydrate ABC transporter ATP-binding protein, CUT1 family [Rubellimicrobium thermophilum DSM 16684]
MASVAIRGLKKAYGSVPVIHGVDIDIEDGEFVVLVGPSGCGKSTLLRMIAGLESISDGEITIDGRRVNDLEPKDRDIAMVFQNYALYPQMTVAQNMGFALELAGRRRAEIQAEIARAAEILSLTPLLDRKPAQLSGGQRQRVAIGRAIVRHPKVFLFDEPLSNLDAKLRVQMRSEIKALHRRLRATIVYVTHDQVEAMTMADRIVVMNGGRVEQIGQPLDLYDHPANLFVAQFIGSPAMNILPAVAVAPGQLRLSDGSVIAAPPGFPLRHGREIHYGLRPEDVRFGEGLPGHVIDVEPTGSETFLVVSVAGHEIMALAKERLMVAPGDPIQVALESPKAHLFDAKNGLRLRLPDAA